MFRGQRAAVVSVMNQQGAVKCSENLQMSAEQAAALLLSMRNLTDTLYDHQLKGKISLA